VEGGRRRRQEEEEDEEEKEEEDEEEKEEEDEEEKEEAGKEEKEETLRVAGILYKKCSEEEKNSGLTSLRPAIFLGLVVRVAEKSKRCN